MQLYLGDCLDKLKEIKESSIDLIYLDPPFYTQKMQKGKSKNNDKEYEFKDSWDSIEHYLNYMEERLKECKRILKDTGSIFLHCDKIASHHLRVVLDKVLGIENFQSEIIWTYKRWSNAKKGLLNSHQNIYFYSKTKNFKFNMKFKPYSETTNLDQILQKRKRNEHGKSEYMTDKNGNAVIDSKKKGVPLGDVWEIPFLNPKAKERVGYPTQKPILLLEQIIDLVTNEEDIVLDPFCGSGTTLVAAKLMNRKYIGIDASEDAIELAEKRLKKPIKTTSSLLEKGKSSYNTKSQEEQEILKILNANPVQRNKGIDGFLVENYKGGLVSVRIQKEQEAIEDALKLLKDRSLKKGCKKMILVRTSNLSTNSLFKEEIEESNELVIIDSPKYSVSKMLSE